MQRVIKLDAMMIKLGLTFLNLPWWEKCGKKCQELGCAGITTAGFLYVLTMCIYHLINFIFWVCTMMNFLSFFVKD